MREDVLMRKLIADGEGIGEERRIQQIAIFLREANKKGEKKVSEAVRILKILDGLEMSMLKQKQIAEMNVQQAKDFDGFSNVIDSEIDETHRKMEEAKQQLVEARIVKKNRQAYSTVVKEINQVPSRSEITRNLAEVRDELYRRHEQQKVLEARLIERRNQLQTLNIVLANMRRFCTEDDETTAETTTENGDEEGKTEVDEWREEVQSMQVS